MTQRLQHLEKLVTNGAERLLRRAADTRSVDTAAMAQRIRGAIEKYLLKDQPAPAGAAINEFIDSLRADDLCLVIACERGDDAAWNDLVERFGATVRSAARSASSNDDAAEDLAQSIWAELHGLRSRGDQRAGGKLGYYSGRGSLGGWLRAVVSQLAVDQHRKSARLMQTEEDTDFDRMQMAAADRAEVWSGGGPATDPEQALDRRAASRDVEAALGQAFAELDPEDRLLLKLYYFDDLRLREAGAVLGVHEATASRRLARIQVDVRKRVEAILVEERGWTRDETARSLADVAANLEGDIQLALADRQPAADERVG